MYVQIHTHTQIHIDVVSIRLPLRKSGDEIILIWWCVIPFVRQKRANMVQKMGRVKYIEDLLIALWPLGT